MNFLEENGIELVDILGNCDDADFIRLKVILLCLTKTKLETDIIELLSQGYDIKEVAEVLDYHPEYVRTTLRGFRKRCQE